MTHPSTITKIAERLAEEEEKVGHPISIGMSTEDLIAFIFTEARELYPAEPELVVGPDYAPRWKAPSFQSAIDAILSEHAERKGEG